MLESLVSSLLTKYLGDYIEGLDSDNLNIGVTSGNVVLTNLRLKKSALESLELPIIIKEGLLGKLELQIPWRDLSSKPAIVRIERIYLIVSPKPKDSSDAGQEELEVRVQQTKQRRLQLAELLGMDKPEKEEPKDTKQQAKKDDGFFARLGMKVVDNLQVFVDKIHIRYEDSTSNPNHPFAFGITLGGLHAQSTDVDWKPTFLTVGDILMRKLVTLSNLAVYFNTSSENTAAIKYSNIDDMAAILDKLIPSDHNSQLDHAFVMKPISGVLKAMIDKGDQFVADRPRVHLDFNLQEVGLGLNPGQYRRILDVVDFFANYNLNLPYVKFKPKKDETPSKDPRRWWKYAIDCVRNNVRSKYEKWQWNYIHQRKLDRVSYVAVYQKKQKLTEKKLSQVEKDTLASLEKKLEYEDIVMFRKLANASIDREKAKEEAEKAASGGGGVTGWISSWWGGGNAKKPPASPQEAQAAKEAQKLDEAQAMKELYQAVGFDETAPKKDAVFPKDYTKTKIDFRMTKAAIELANEDGNRDPILSAYVNELDVAVHMREDSLTLAGDLEGVHVTEFHTLNGQELQAVQPDFTSSINESLIGDGKDDQPSPRSAGKGKKFMRFQFDSNPLDCPADAPLDVRLKLRSHPLVIKFSKPLIDKIADCFASGEQSTAGYDQIASAATAGFEAIKQRAQTSIKYTIEQKQKLEIDIKLQAPKILVPKSFTDPNCPTAVLDLGLIHFKSDPHANKKAVSFGDGEINPKLSDEYFYDHYSIQLFGLHAMIASDGSKIQSNAPGVVDAQYCLINKFDLTFDLKLLTAATTQLPKVKLTGRLPFLRVDMDRNKLAALLEVVSVLATPVAEAAAVAPASNRDSKSAKVKSVAISKDDSSRRNTRRMTLSGMNRRTMRALSQFIPENEQRDEAQQQEKAAEQHLVAIDFSIASIALQLGLILEDKLQPVVEVSLNEVNLNFSQSNWKMVVGLELQSLQVEDLFAGKDTDKSTKFLVDSGIVSDEDKLIAITYVGTPKNSIAYNKIDHKVDVRFNTLTINVNRLTVATLLQIATTLTAPAAGGSDVQASVQEMQDDVVDDQSNPASADEDSIWATPPAEFDFSLAVVKVAIKSVAINLNKEMATFMKLELGRATVDVDVRGDTTMAVSGRVGTLSLREVSDQPRLWGDMISIASDKMIDFHYETFSDNNPKASLAYKGHDMAVTLNIGSMRFVFISRILKELTIYFGAFAKMQEMVKAAASYYYSASIDAVQASAKTTKVLLDIEINNPLIIVPVSSTSRDSLSLDLGKISLKNEFDTSHQVIRDNMAIVISSLNLKTTKFYGGEFELEETVVPIIDNTNFVLMLRRAAGPNPENAIPDINMTVSVSGIHIAITEDQLQQSLSVLTENMLEESEGDDDTELEKVADSLQAARFWSPEYFKYEAAKAAAEAAEDAKVAVKQAFITQAIRADFAELSLEVLEGKGFTGPESKSTSVAKFAMRRLVADLTMKSDSSMLVEVFLHEIMLEDTRLDSSNKFKRILTPTLTGQDAPPVIYVKYQMDQKAKLAAVGVVLNRPRFYLIPESLNNIYKYAMPLSARSQKAFADYAAKSNPVVPKAEEVEKSDAGANPGAGAGAKDDDAEVEETVMKIDISLKSPEICAVDDSTKSLPAAFLMHLGNSDIKMITSSGGDFKMAMNLEQFDIQKCFIDAYTQTAQDAVLLLQPFTIATNMSNGGQDRTMKLAIDLGLFRTISSYRDVLLGIRIWHSFQPLLQSFQQSTAMPPTQAISSQPSIDLKKTDEAMSQALVPAVPLEAAVIEDDKLTQNIIFSMKGVYLALLNDKVDPAYAAPLIKMWVDGIDSRIDIRQSGAMEVMATIHTIDMNAYNNELAAFEPVIEPWGLMYKKYGQRMDLHIEADELLDINLTKSFIDGTLTSLELIKDFSNPDLLNAPVVSPTGEEKRLSFNPYIIRNRSGHKIRYWLSGTTETTGRTVEDGIEEPLILNREDRTRNAEQPIRYEVDIRIVDSGNFDVLKNIVVHRVGTSVRTPSLMAPHMKLVVQVEYEKGSKIITLRSDHTVHNNTSYPIEVQLKREAKEHTLEVIQPNSYGCIPMSFCNFNQLLFRPVLKDASAENQFSFFEVKRTQKNGLIACKSETDPDQRWLCAYHQSIVDTVDGFVDSSIVLRPAFVIENTLPVSLDWKIMNTKKKDAIVAESTKHLGTEKEELIYVFRYFERVRDLCLAIKVPGFDWSRKVEDLLHERREEPWQFSLKDPAGSSLHLHADSKLANEATTHVAIFSNYWIINQTGLPLQYNTTPGGKKLAAGQPADASSAPLDGHPRTWTYGASDLNRSRFLYGEKGISVRTSNSSWSKSFPLGVQNQGAIFLDDEKSGRCYHYAVVVSPAPGKFWRTKIAHFYPGIIVVNKTGRTILIKQRKHDALIDVVDNEQLRFHWPAAKNTKKIQIAYADHPTFLTTCVSVNSITTMQLKLRDASGAVRSLDDTVQLRVKLINGTTFVVLTDPANTASDAEDGTISATSTYRIENHTSQEVAVKQKGTEWVQKIGPGSTIPYVWDEPQVEEPLLLLRVVAGETSWVEVPLDAISEEIPSYRTSVGEFAMEIVADGPTKVLHIRPAADKGADKKDDVSDDRAVSMEIKASMKGIGVSIVDSSPQEIMYITLQTILARYEVSNVDTRVELKIGTGQIDNQLYMTPFPILLWMKPVPDPFIHFSMVKDSRYTAIQFFQYLAFQLQEVDVKIDQQFLIRALNWWTEFSPVLSSRNVAELEKDVMSEKLFEETKLSDDELKVADMYHFVMFHLNPIKANVTFIANPDPNATGGEETVIEQVLGYVGVLANIDRAPLELNGLLLEHPFTSLPDLTSRITQHYTQAAIRQAYLLVGSADFLGNPVSFVSNLGTGVRDFFYEPAMGIVKSPEDFGKGLAKGTSSLVKKSTYALFDTASKLTGTVAKVGATLTMDDDYQRERAARAANQAKHAGEGIAYGFRDFGIGIYKGITGIVTEPIKGGKKDGALGVLKGVGKGLAGVVLKPAVGAVDLFTRTTEGIKNTTTYFDEKSKAPIRPSRYFPPDKLVTTYHLENSAGQQILKTVEPAEYRKEHYVSHMAVKEACVLATTARLLFLEQQVLQFGNVWNVEWAEVLQTITDIDVKGNSLLVYINPPARTGEQAHTRTIECTSTDQVKQLYKLVSGSSGIRHSQQPVAVQQRIEEALKLSSPDEVAVRLDEAFDDEQIAPPVAHAKINSDPSDPEVLEPNQHARDDEPLLARRRKVEKQRRAKRQVTEKTRLLDKEGEESEGCCACCTVM